VTLSASRETIYDILATRRQRFVITTLDFAVSLTLRTGIGQNQ
jgi:hypothetical protein